MNILRTLVFLTGENLSSSANLKELERNFETAVDRVTFYALEKKIRSEQEYDFLFAIQGEVERFGQHEEVDVKFLVQKLNEILDKAVNRNIGWEKAEFDRKLDAKLPKGAYYTGVRSFMFG